MKKTRRPIDEVMNDINNELVRRNLPTLNRRQLRNVAIAHMKAINRSEQLNERKQFLAFLNNRD